MSVCFFVCLSVCLFVCLPVYMSVCLSVCRYFSLSVSLSVSFVCLSFSRFVCSLFCVFVYLFICLLDCHCVCLLASQSSLLSVYSSVIHITQSIKRNISLSFSRISVGRVAALAAILTTVSYHAVNAANAITPTVSKSTYPKSYCSADGAASTARSAKAAVITPTKLTSSCVRIATSVIIHIV